MAINENNIKNKQGGFIDLIILIVVVLLLLRFFNLTISGVLAYFHLSIPGIISWFQDLFHSVVK